MTNRIERHVVLVSPEIPWNTGSIGRTCLATGSYLHLVKPLGFSLDARQVKRAGLDYWPHVQVRVWDHFQAWQDALQPQPAEVVLLAKRGRRSFRSLPQSPRLFLVFGAESQGLPTAIVDQYPQATYHIPIQRATRSLNLATAVGIVLYESLRPCDVPHEWEPEPVAQR